MAKKLTCDRAGGPTPCRGKVHMITINPRTLREAPLCAAHAEEQDARNAHINELLSPLRPAWFDPSYAGERWDEDD